MRNTIETMGEQRSAVHPISGVGGWGHEGGGTFYYPNVFLHVCLKNSNHKQYV